MAVTVLPFPDLPFEKFEMRPIAPQDISPMEERGTESADYGTAYWVLDAAQTPKLTNEEVDVADTFFQQASPALTVFECHDIYRPRPRAYGGTPLGGNRANGSPFDGTATLSQITDSLTINVSNLPAAFAINKSCLVEIRKSPTVRSLHRVMSAAVANGSGVATLSIRHPLDTGVFTAANSIVVFEKPSCLMKLKPGWSLPKGRGGRRARFSAEEVFPYA